MIMDELAEHEVVYSAIKSSEKRTNFERIKNMSVEEMAEILFSSCTENIDCEFKPETCKQCVSKWLNSESEVENGLPIDFCICNIFHSNAIRFLLLYI